MSSGDSEISNLKVMIFIFYQSPWEKAALRLLGVRKKNCVLAVPSISVRSRLADWCDHRDATWRDKWARRWPDRKPSRWNVRVLAVWDLWDDREGVVLDSGTEAEMKQRYLDELRKGVIAEMDLFIEGPDGTQYAFNRNVTPNRWDEI